MRLSVVACLCLDLLLLLLDHQFDRLLELLLVYLVLVAHVKFVRQLLTLQSQLLADLLVVLYHLLQMNHDCFRKPPLAVVVFCIRRNILQQEFGRLRSEPRLCYLSAPVWSLFRVVVALVLVERQLDALRDGV